MSVFGRNEWFIRQKAEPAISFDLKLPDSVKEFFKWEMKGIFKSENCINCIAAVIHVW